MTITSQVNEQTFDGIDTTGRASLLSGAQDGWRPILGELTKQGPIEAWSTNSAYVTTDIIAIPLLAPKFFNEFTPEQAKFLKNNWVDIMSVLPTTIDGLESTLTVTNDDVTYGGSGNLVMKEATNVTKAVSNITNEYVERQGLAINTFLEFLIRYGVGDEYTDAPEIITVGDTRSKFKGKVCLQDYYTGTILYIELDRMRANVMKAYLAVGVRPENGGTITAKKDKANAKEVTRYSVPINCMVDSNLAIRAYAQTIYDKMSIFDLNSRIETVIPVTQTEVATTVSDVTAGEYDTNGFHRTGFDVDETALAKEDISTVFQPDA